MAFAYPERLSTVGLPFACLVALLLVSTAWAAAPLPLDAPPALRDFEPAVLRGSALPELLGRPTAELGVFRYDAAGRRFEPIPFQVDERFVKTFDPGTAGEFSETVYDVFGEEDGLFDADDELAFMYRDGGTDRADLTAVWPAGAHGRVYEIKLQDAHTGSPAPARWAYVFDGVGLPTSPARYLTWNETDTGAVTSDWMTLGYTSRWLLDEYRVQTPCGSGLDLIDRFKGRAGLSLDKAESEQIWDQTSTFLGGKLGPVRAIRYVRGAASGVNTTHHDVIYDRMFVRRAMLRVHPLNQIWFYFDWLPDAGMELYTPENDGGLTVDGTPDPDVDPAFEDWHVMRGPGGGAVLFYNVPPSPLYMRKYFFYRDDAAFDDSPHVGYLDQDDQLFGAHGVSLQSLSGSAVEAIDISFRFYSICGGEGNAALGELAASLAESPLMIESSLHSQTILDVRTLRVERSGSDIALDWDTLTGASRYVILAAESPDLPAGSWTELGRVDTPPFEDAGAAGSSAPRFYRIVVESD